MVIIVGQVIITIVLVYFIAFKAMGKDFDAAVLSAGICGFGMGAIPNGIANMEPFVENYGPAPRAFFILPVGAFLMDFTNIIIINFFSVLVM